MFSKTTNKSEVDVPRCYSHALTAQQTHTHTHLYESVRVRVCVRVSSLLGFGVWDIRLHRSLSEARDLHLVGLIGEGALHPRRGGQGPPRGLEHVPRTRIGCVGSANALSERIKKTTALARAFAWVALAWVAWGSYRPCLGCMGLGSKTTPLHRETNKSCNKLCIMGLVGR